jgi:hypothetical protein
MNIDVDQSKTSRKKRRSLAVAAVGIPVVLWAIPWYPPAVNMAPHVAVVPTASPSSQSVGSSDFRREIQSAAVVIDAPTPGEQTKDALTVYHYVGSGLAENSWDFTDPEGVPGFGRLDPADAQRLLTLVGHQSGR